MARTLNLLGIASGSVGIFFGFFFLGEDASLMIRMVALFTVGINGTLAFVRHVIFHKSDAERLGWKTDRPDWMFEVGFANLAFAIATFIALMLKNGETSLAVLTAGFAVYLLQAAILHAYRYFTDEEKSPGRLWRSFLLTVLFSAMMLLFAVNSLLANP